MLQLITQRLQSLQSSGQWDQTMDAFKQRVIENSQRPAPVEGIKRAEKYEQRWFDPSIRLTEDLKDNEGRVFARKGEVVNPLKNRTVCPDPCTSSMVTMPTSWPG